MNSPVSPVHPTPDGDGRQLALIEGLEEMAKPDRPVSEILRGVSTYASGHIRRQIPQIVSDWSVI